MLISLLVYMIAADYLVDKKGYIKVTILLIIGVISYQATISMFFASVILFTILKGKGYKNILKEFVIAVLLSFVAILIDYIQIMFFQKYTGIIQTRIDNNMFINIVLITYYIGRIIVVTGNYFPILLYISFIIIIQELVVYKTIKYNRCKDGERFLIEQLILVIACILLSFIPSILSLTALESGRIRFSMGATIGILFIHIITKSDLQDLKKKVNKILIIVLIAYSIANSINYIYLINLNGKVNSLDEKNAIQIGEYIKEYEKMNNIQVNKIAIVYDIGHNKKPFSWFDDRHVGITMNSVRTRWAVDGLINYYTGRNLEKVDVTEEEEKLYREKVDKQKDYMCIGDTLYISIYYK